MPSPSEPRLPIDRDRSSSSWQLECQDVGRQDLDDPLVRERRAAVSSPLEDLVLAWQWHAFKRLRTRGDVLGPQEVPDERPGDLRRDARPSTDLTLQVLRRVVGDGLKFHPDPSGQVGIIL